MSSRTLNIEAQDFARFAFHGHFERATTNLAVRGELLARNRGIDRDLESLPTEWAKNLFPNFHELTVAFVRTEEQQVNEVESAPQPNVAPETARNCPAA